MEKEDSVQDQSNFVKEVKIVFSNKNKVADTEWKIEMFKQGKKHIADFMIEFEVLAMKTKTNNMYTIFLLKKNVRSNIIKTVLGYLPITVPEILKECQVVVILVRQVYKFIEGRQYYRTGLRIIYRGKGAPMNIGKSKDNYNKNGKPRYFDYNIYEYMFKDCWKPKKREENQKVLQV